MDDILRKPYEISVWQDQQHYILSDGTDTTVLIELQGKTVVNDYLEEIKVGVIGSNTMDTPIRALNPHLISKINGSHDFTFEMHSKYINDEGELVDNPWFSYIIPERKVKLKYDGVWYDFIITERSETRTQYNIKISCTDLFISELSKNGYNIELNTELFNNQGTTQELGDIIVEESNWHIAPTDAAITLGDGYATKSDVIKQYNNEALFIYGVSDAFTATIMGKSGTVDIPRLATIYICYSSLANKESTIQFFWNSDNNYVLSDNGTILNSEHYEVAASALPNATPEKCAISTKYRGDKLVRQQRSKYIEVADKFCTEYNGPDANETYYCYKDYTYTSGANLQQLITNNENFISTMGWVAEDGSSVDNLTDGSLKFSFARGNISNTGLYDNRSWFSNGFIAGDKLVLRIKYATDSNTFTSISINYQYIDETGPHSGTIGSSFQGTSDDYAWYYFDLPSLSYNQLVSCSVLNLQFFSGNTVTVKEFSLFKYITDTNGNLIIPDLAHTLAAEVVKPTYYIFTKTAADRAIVATDIVYTGIYYDALPSIYTPKYADDFAKIRSIEGEKSNRFNLLQEICETFECWAKFYIAHDSLGKIYYSYQLTKDTTPIEGKRYYQALNTTDNREDKNYKYITTAEFVANNTYEKVYDKYIEFLEYISTDNYAGFRPGINLQNIQRTINSEEIVTKLIVEPNSNKYAPDGFCDIQLSDMNYYGENTIYNFDYYINQGILDKSDLYRDLYNDSNTNGIGLLPKLQNLNANNKQNITLASQLNITLTKAKAKLQAYKSKYYNAVAKQTEYEGYIIENHPPLNEDPTYVPTEDVPDSVHDWYWMRKTFYEQAQAMDKYVEEYTTMVSTYQQKYNTVLELLAEIARKKSALYKEFNSKYGRYVKEGSWISEEYQDPDLYYLDALGVLYNSAFPKLSYSINVIDVSPLDEYKGYTFKLGDKTYIEDTEFFGWAENGMPYKEEVILSEIDYALDNPANNKITVQNYKDRFESLFQRITATSQSLQYSAGGYARAAASFNSDGSINSALMDRALNENSAVISNATDQSVVWDNQGITISSILSPNEIVRLVNGGIVLTNDAGRTWTTGITAEGINAKAITTGVLNTNLIRIYNGTAPSFVWDADGINAYSYDGSIISDDTYVRFDSQGLHGYKNNQSFFDLGYDAFELQALNGTNYVKIGTNYSPEEGQSLRPVIKAGTGSTDSFVVYEDGSVKANNGIFRGTIYATDGEFSGELRAATGEFIGTLKASDILLGSGDNWTSILSGGKIKNNYLDLGNIQIDGNNTTISLGNGGVISIGGALSISADGITWNDTTKSGLKGVAFSGSYNDLDDQPTIPPGYGRSDVELLLAEYGITDTTTTSIGSCYIYSPTIMGGTFYAIDGSNTDTYAKLTTNQFSFQQGSYSYGYLGFDQGHLELNCGNGTLTLCGFNGVSIANSALYLNDLIVEYGSGAPSGGGVDYQIVFRYT